MNIDIIVLCLCNHLNFKHDFAALDQIVKVWNMKDVHYQVVNIYGLENKMYPFSSFILMVLTNAKISTIHLNTYWVGIIWKGSSSWIIITIYLVWLVSQEVENIQRLSIYFI